MPSEFVDRTKVVTVPLMVAFPLHFAWESVQCVPFFIHPEEAPGPFWLIMGVATLGDVGLTFVVWFGGSMLFRCSRWYLTPWSGFTWAYLTTSGILISVAIEFYAGATARWAYSDLAPMVPGTSISLIPVLQLLVLLPATFKISRRLILARTNKRA